MVEGTIFHDDDYYGFDWTGDFVFFAVESLVGGGGGEEEVEEEEKREGDSPEIHLRWSVIRLLLLEDKN
jgi:hypothetical protein